MIFFFAFSLILLSWALTSRSTFKKKLLSLEKDNTALRPEIEKLNQALTKAKEEVDQLSVFRSVKSADEEANRILSSANTTAAEVIAKSKEEAKLIKEQADSYLRPAKDEAKAIVSKARDQSAAIISKAESELFASKKLAQETIQSAEKKAVEIAGDAIAALQKAQNLEKTAKAMKNIIEGYGDQYLIPTQSLLDQLGEAYSHTDAGNELKQARERTRLMIKNKTAATCDYVEEHRKQTAIEFVMDAFIGKVDSILATAKQDNYGTLQEKIKDAFTTVNHNGAAFRDARVQDQFLWARLEELKWACTVQAIKERDREEQRKMREIMREEEKAAREIEKALKEAEKEEQSISKAMDKVRKDLDSANEAQKLKYEAKLAELQQRLIEAEEKNQRALSMAQQTKRGHVYIISNIGSFGEDVLKVGMTRRLDPMDRVWELGDASVPFDFDVHAMIFSEDAPALEKALHSKFADAQVNKVNVRKEFFKTEIANIKSEIERMGIQAHWTMSAEAREFRESLAMIKTDKNKRAA